MGIVPGTYSIYVRGRIGPEMRYSLAELSPQVRGGYTVLRLDTADQASLHGVLNRLRDLALEVESVWRTDSESSG